MIARDRRDDPSGAIQFADYVVGGIRNVEISHPIEGQSRGATQTRAGGWATVAAKAGHSIPGNGHDDTRLAGGNSRQCKSEYCD
jgi:hypothetical protein